MSYRVTSTALLLGVLSISTACIDTGVESKAANKKIIVPQSEYTREQPGDWMGLVDDHLPKVEIFSDESANNIIVRVDLPSRSKNHYIERIGVMAADKSDLAGISFNRNSVEFRGILTVHPLPHTRNVKVYAKCNLHDLWTVPLPY